MKGCDVEEVKPAPESAPVTRLMAARDALYAAQLAVNAAVSELHRCRADYEQALRDVGYAP